MSTINPNQTIVNVPRSTRPIDTLVVAFFMFCTCTWKSIATSSSATAKSAARHGAPHHDR